jgi:S1-C subfamily serine protease
MSKLKAAVILGLAVLGASWVVSTASAQVDAKYVNEKLVPATALLYSQSADGGMSMRCTTTAIEHNATGYVFVTASHCGCEDNADKKTVSPEKIDFYVTPDDKTEKVFIKAKVTGCGYKHKGDDFMLLQIDTDKTFPVIPLGDDPKVLDPIVNVASPLGLGKQVFVGSVSSASIDRPVIEGDINWEGVVAIQMFGVDGGSSGSSIVCMNQKAICAFVVGSIDRSTMTAMPVSRLKKLQASLGDGSYKFFVADPDSNGAKPTPEKQTK